MNFSEFWSKVFLLLWKNFSLRKRQILRNIVEILWPLGIFLILAAVRGRKAPIFVPANKGSIYFAPRALPSAGALPFVQSLFCNYKLDRFFTKPQDIPDISQTILYKLVHDFGPIVTNETNLRNIEVLSKELSSIFNDFINTSNIFNTTEFPIEKLFFNKDVAISLLTNITLENSTAQALLSSKIKIKETFLHLAGFDWNKLNPFNLMQDLKDHFCFNDTLGDILEFPVAVNKSLVVSDICNHFEQIVLLVFSKENEIRAVLRNSSQFQDFENMAVKMLTQLNALYSQIENVNITWLIKDFSQLIQPFKQSMGDSSKLFNIRYILCGGASPNISERQNQSNSDSNQSKKPLPLKGGGLSSSCNQIPPANRTDCGWGGISESQCYKLNCCFDSSIPATKFCFCPTNNVTSCCYKRRKLVETISLSSGYTPQMVDFLSMTLEGKILYAPNNNKTRNVIQKITAFITSITNPLSNQTDVKLFIEAVFNFTSELLKDRQYLDKINLLIPMTQSPLVKNILRFLQIYNITDKENNQFENTLSTIKMLINSTYLSDENIWMMRNITYLALQYYADISSALDCYDFTSFFVPFNTEEDLVNYAIKKNTTFLSSVVFLNLEETKPFPKKVAYKLRFNPDYTPTTSQVKSQYWKPGPGTTGPLSFWNYEYINFGFVFLQDMLDRTLIEILSNKTVYQPGVYVQQFPYPCYIEDMFISYLGRSMPLFMTIAWVYTIAMVVKSIVYEKEMRLKEVMKVMGLTDSIHWTAWFITSFVSMLLSIVVLVIVLKFGKILIYSDFSLVVFVMSIFASASIAMAFLISVFFSRANISAACGGIIYFFTYLPYVVTIYFEDGMTFNSLSAVSLLSTTSFGLGFKYISRWEEQGIGAQWANIFQSPSSNDKFSLGWAVNFMIIDFFIYSLMVWYFSKVFPGEYGIPKIWYFPFTKSYWFDDVKQKHLFVQSVHSHSKSGYNMMNDQTTSAVEGDADFNNTEVNFNRSEDFEKEPTDLPIGIHIKNLVKVYLRGNKCAVDNLNLKMYEGQVTALLGHNGAGKSTTMSILTGLFPPTSGTALVCGYDIVTNIEKIRKSLGICPQHNVLFDNLTVEEHMWFYGKLKGMSNEKLNAEVERFVVDVGLPKKRNELSRNLSGGMKRKLSVAMAFIANSKTVILDEPTSGVDPYSRRGIWDLILKHKQGRTILLSTHYMDEADVLGDRISIISNGKLKCNGSPLFLKRRFGRGYVLTILLDGDTIYPQSSFQLQNFISSFVPGALLDKTLNNELTFLLPSAARLTGEFENLFYHLEESMKTFGIQSYGVSDTSLEEKACDDEGYLHEDGPSMGDILSSSRMNHEQISLASFDSLSALTFSNNELLEPGINDFESDFIPSNCSLWLQQYKAVLTKRFYHAIRSRKGFFSQILLPAIFVVAAMCVSLIRPPRVAQPSLKLSTEMFSKPNYVVVDVSNYNNFSENLLKSYVEYPGPDGGCEKMKSCIHKKNPFHHNPNSSKLIQTLHCSCSTGKQKCVGNLPKTPMLLANNGDTFLDVSGYDINEYLLSTSDAYVKERYGGASFSQLKNRLPDLETSNFSWWNFASSFGVKQNVKVWYNLKGYHSLPVYINFMNNAILRANLPSTEDLSQYGITAYNHPMDLNQEQLQDEVLRQGLTNLFVAIFVILALAFVPASFLVYLVQDRASKCKHLQIVSGLNPVVYWVANYTWDMMNYLIPAFSCIFIFLMFNQQAYVSSQNFPVTLILLLLYGWSMTPLMYPMSFVFEVPSTAYIVMIQANLFVGIIGTIATFILEYIGDGDQELTNINHVLKQVLLIFPNFCMGRGLMELAGNQLKADVYKRFGLDSFKDPFAWEITGRNIFAMAVSGFFYFFFTLLCQYNFFKKPWVYPIKKDLHKRIIEEDVAREEHRIAKEESEGKKFILKALKLSKVYKDFMRKKKILAVNQLTFGVKEGECFGLLGVNGAGKTSTFKMLTGDINITDGDAFINNQSVSGHLTEVYRSMGYCPQFDAIDELLTGNELLLYFAQLRGLNMAESIKAANWAIHTLGLSQYKDKRCGDYSGGNKRKLSTAIALIGRPPLIFLDEPTTGMDPGARRFLWNVINSLLKAGKSVVITSHNMEECETLCSQIAIMVNGEFKCIGSPQHLRSKYGVGYIIIIRCYASSFETIDTFIKSSFANASLQDRHHNMLEYRIPSIALKLSDVFHKLEQLRKTESIDDYSITQTTLDQIFVNFARAQIESQQIIESDNMTLTSGMMMDDVSRRNVVI
ncbi:ATP-binding cassette sub-family A member 2 isoform X3 [Hydra vulgaris]|uniref:ATP-binding cassette sub-family A member 2 isoform X3 n=1 Tax=Hydra vulgaris TaxID=6087 RepID=A0ABM4BMX2_HYDVU